MSLTTKIPLDIDAQRFVQAAGLSNFNQIRAVDYLVRGLKTNNLWIKCAAIYPLVGGTATTCKFNLKDPRDSDLAFRLTFVASPSITYKGVDWNGTTQYANTNCIAGNVSIISQNSMHLSVYNRENTATSGVDIGLTGAGGALINTRANYLINGASKSFVNADSSGFFIASRTASNLTTLYRNGVSADTTNVASAAPVPTISIFIGARNATGSPLTFSDRQMAFASIGSAITSTEAFIFNQIVQQFQIILQRTL